jgi:hypothetical protein
MGAVRRDLLYTPLHKVYQNVITFTGAVGRDVLPVKNCLGPLYYTIGVVGTIQL